MYTCNIQKLKLNRKYILIKVRKLKLNITVLTKTIKKMYREEIINDYFVYK